MIEAGISHAEQFVPESDDDGGQHKCLTQLILVWCDEYQYLSSTYLTNLPGSITRVFRTS